MQRYAYVASMQRDEHSVHNVFAVLLTADNMLLLLLVKRVHVDD
jgi:hypothetical protein